jgi:hypothetical protein
VIDLSIASFSALFLSMNFLNFFSSIVSPSHLLRFAFELSSQTLFSSFLLRKSVSSYGVSVRNVSSGIRFSSLHISILIPASAKWSRFTGYSSEGMVALENDTIPDPLDGDVLNMENDKSHCQ